MRDVRNLIPIVTIGGRGDIDGFLPSILGREMGLARGGQWGVALQLEVNAIDIDLPQIEHCPAELLTLGVSYNLVLHMIVIDVCTEL